jgi:hypothetical protein
MGREAKCQLSGMVRDAPTCGCRLGLPPTRQSASVHAYPVISGECRIMWKPPWAEKNEAAYETAFALLRDRSGADGGRARRRVRMLTGTCCYRSAARRQSSRTSRTA